MPIARGSFGPGMKYNIHAAFYLPKPGEAQVEIKDAEFFSRGPYVSYGSGPVCIAKQKITSEHTFSSAVTYYIYKDRIETSSWGYPTRMGTIRQEEEYYGTHRYWMCDGFVARWTQYTPSTGWTYVESWVDSARWEHLYYPPYGDRLVFTEHVQTWRSSFVGNEGTISGVSAKIYGNPSHSTSKGTQFIDPDLTPYAPSDASVDFLYGEKYEFEAITEFGISKLAWRRNWGMAYDCMVDAIPHADTNMIANILEAASTLKSIFTGEWVASLKQLTKKIDQRKYLKILGDGWLQYRYSFTTTKLDLKEIRDAYVQLSSISNMPSFYLSGDYVSDEGLIFRSTAKLAFQDAYPDFGAYLKAYGFNLSLQNMWDMVPYSFVVDWFLHIGDLLDTFESYQQRLNYNFTDHWYTVVGRYDTDFGPLNEYLRFPAYMVGDVTRSIPYITHRNASGKTIGMRALDSVSLFLL